MEHSVLHRTATGELECFHTSCGRFSARPDNSWFLLFIRMTALVVKVLSMVAERQVVAVGQRGRQARIVPFHEISHSVRYLLSVQKPDGSFGDPHPVVHIGVLVMATRYLRCN